MVWKSVTATPLPRKVRDAGERVCRKLRGSGYELAHLAAKVLDIPDGTKRSEISVIWLVPAPDEGIGHRVLAELLTHLFARGVKAGQVEKTAARFATDWEDWAVVRPDEYFRTKGSKALSIPVEGQLGKTWIEARIWPEVLRLLAGECEVDMPHITRSTIRAVKELELEGNIVSVCEVEKIHRRTIGRTHCFPAIRIALQLNSGEVGAIVLIETNGEAGQRKIKGIGVAYPREWPIVHHYRTVIPPPDLGGLAKLVQLQV